MHVLSSKGAALEHCILRIKFPIISHMQDFLLFYLYIILYVIWEHAHDNITHTHTHTHTHIYIYIYIIICSSYVMPVFLIVDDSSVPDLSNYLSVQYVSAWVSNKLSWIVYM